MRVDDADVASSTPSYSPTQRRAIQQLLAAAQGFGATPREEKALLEAGRVESNYTPLTGGDDRDSTGVLQQRPSQGWGPVGESVGTDAVQFLQAARKARGVQGSAGVLAQAVQRSGFPHRYDEVAGEAASLLGGSGGAQGATGGAQPTDPASGMPQPGSTAGVEALVAAMQQPQQSRPMAGLQAPGFSARPTLAAGAQIPMGGGGPARGGGVDALLSAAAASADTSSPQATAASSGEAPAASSAVVSSGKFPTVKPGKIIGTPHAGTHTLGDWQSDNAVDIGVPVGTPMVSLDDGVVVKVKRHPQGAGRFAGDQITIRGRNGNSYFYAHGVAGVKAGERVQRGQQIGETGSANGVAHLHLGVEHGDPRKVIGRGR